MQKAILGLAVLLPCSSSAFSQQTQRTARLADKKARRG